MNIKEVPVTAANFYTRFPRESHTPGDIWTGLPCDGALSPTPLSGVILTPACDLSNCKVETLTYLPIISLGQYFSTSAVLPAVYKRVLGLCEALQVRSEPWMLQRFELPLASEVQEFRETLSQPLPKHPQRIDELLAGCDVLDSIAAKGLRPVPRSTLKGLFGAKSTDEIIGRIIRNNFSNDLHFLPHDGLNPEYSAVPDHSVALFRYPASVSLEVLENAIDTPTEGWRMKAESLEKRFSGAANLREKRPTKLSTLEPRFFADLLTRYVSLMIRLGAPSFNEASVSKMINDHG